MKSSTKHLSALLILTLALFAVSPANADVIYGAGTNGYSTNQIGMILGSDAPTGALVSNWGGTVGARLAAFRTADGGARVAAAAYSVMNQQSVGDVVWIYDPYNTDWSAPLKEITASENPVGNIRAMAYQGSYLYACGYDYAVVTRFDTTGDKYVCDKKYNSLNDGYHHAEAMVTYNGFVYVVLTYAKNPWGSGGYSNNKLLKFDADLNLLSETELNGKNTDGGTVGAVCLKGSKLYIASIGGAQSYSGTPNAGSNIDVVDLDTLEVKELISIEALFEQFGAGEAICGTDYDKETFPCDFKTIVVTDAGDVYVVMNGWTASGGKTAVFKTTVSDLENAKNNAKSAWKLVKWFDLGGFIMPGAIYDEATGTLYVCGSEENEYSGGALYYTKDGGATWDRYDSKTLGGYFSGVACDVLLKPATSPVTSGDVTISGDAKIVYVDAGEDFGELDGKEDYSRLVNGASADDVIFPGRSITLELDFSDASGAITLTISNFSTELSEGASPKAFLKKLGAAKFDMLDAVYDDAAHTLTISIAPIGDFFAVGSTNKIIIGQISTKSAISPSSPSSGGSGGGSSNPTQGEMGGGCSTVGLGVLALLAIAPIGLRKRK